MLLFVETTAVDALSAEVGIISMQTCVERQCKNTTPIAAQRWTEVTTMAEYHVGCGAFGIYAGTLNSRNENMWQNKTECTDEAICAVRDYLVQELLGGLDCKKATSNGYEWTLKDGRAVELRVTIKAEGKRKEPDE